MRVNEPVVDFALPRFDSLPATTGLTNVEAFRLSVRHALALLPRIINDSYFAAHFPVTERFRLD
jgi:hypothetical protein